VKEVSLSHGVVRFSAFEVDFRNGEVRKHGFKVRIQDQPFHVLQVLLEHPGELVTREELQRQIWPADTFVDFEKGLNNAIKRLRDALGDSAEQPRYIETHSRHGYRFIGSVTAATNSGARRAAERALIGEAVVPSRSRPRYRRLAAGAVLFVAFAATLFEFDVGGVRQRWLTRTSSPVIHSLAVLPLTNLSNDSNQEYFSDGMTDALITDLAQIGSLKVISRTSIMRYKRTDKSLPEIARELNVDGIVEGTVQRSGDRVRITVQLVHGPSDKHVWASSYERDVRDVLVLQQGVTDEITRQIQARVTMPNRTSLAHPHAVNPKVLEAYIEGNYHLHGRGRGADDEEPRKARAYFQQAIDADPNFAPAYIGLAYSHDPLSRGSSDDLLLMRRAAEKAIELDPSSSEAWVALAGAKRDGWDWNEAAEDYRRALALNPNNALAHEGLGYIHDEMGRLDEGWKEFQLAQELDPNRDHLAEALYQRGQFDRAIEIRQRIALRDPGEGYNHYAQAMNYAQKGMYKEFVQEMGTSATLYGVPEVGDRLRHAYDESGYQGALRQLAKDFEHGAATKQFYYPGVLAQLYTALGDKDRAFYWLEQFHQHHDLATADPSSYFKTNPWFAPIRSDPRFSDFLRRAGLPPQP
jgi:TolB-like protein/DNA-binding winged helix-turn-helix (wHTH) protein/Tfp pilus assembly protein PilF